MFAFVDLLYVFNCDQYMPDDDPCWVETVAKTIHLGLPCPKRTGAHKILEPINWRPPSIRSSELTSLPKGWTPRMTSTETRIKIRTLATSIIFIISFISSFVIIQVVSVPTPRKRSGAVQQEGALCLWEEPCRERHGWGWSFLLFVSRSKQKREKSINLNWKNS